MTKKKKRNSHTTHSTGRNKKIRNDSETFETLIDDCRYRIPGEREVGEEELEIGSQDNSHILCCCCCVLLYCRKQSYIERIWKKWKCMHNRSVFFPPIHPPNYSSPVQKFFFVFCFVILFFDLLRPRPRSTETRLAIINHHSIYYQQQLFGGVPSSADVDPTAEAAKTLK